MKLIRAGALLAFGLCVCLSVDALLPLPAFCRLESACQAAIRSNLGRIAGLPLPVVGAAAFAALFCASLSQRDALRRLARHLALAAGAIGAGLLAFQAVALSSYCPWCVAIDLAAVAIAIAAVDSRVALPPAVREPRILWFAALEIAFGLPLIVAWLMAPSALPADAKSHWVSGKVNVIEITSFDCPHCREMHPVVERVVSKSSKDINYVRLSLPLADTPDSKAACLGLLCSEREGRGRLFANELFRSADRSRESCERAAVEAGISSARFRACMVDPGSASELDSRIARLRPGLLGLPTICIQEQVFVGAHSEDVLHDAIEKSRSALQVSRN